MWCAVQKVAIISLRFSYQLEIHRNNEQEEKFVVTEELD